MLKFLFEVTILFTNSINVIKVLAIADYFIQLIYNSCCLFSASCLRIASAFPLENEIVVILVSILISFQTAAGPLHNDIFREAEDIILQFWLCIPCPLTKNY